jgi:hypothetical protein
MKNNYSTDTKNLPGRAMPATFKGRTLCWHVEPANKAAADEFIASLGTGELILYMAWASGMSTLYNRFFAGRYAKIMTQEEMDFMNRCETERELGVAEEGRFGDGVEKVVLAVLERANMVTTSQEEDQR